MREHTEINQGIQDSVREALCSGDKMQSGVIDAGQPAQRSFSQKLSDGFGYAGNCLASLFSCHKKEIDENAPAPVQPITTRS